jgi:hypothetical protein
MKESPKYVNIGCGYRCVKCGKTIAGREGFTPHSAWHRRKDMATLKNPTNALVQKHIDTY